MYIIELRKQQNKIISRGVNEKSKIKNKVKK